MLPAPERLVAASAVLHEWNIRVAQQHQVIVTSRQFQQARIGATKHRLGVQQGGQRRGVADQPAGGGTQQIFLARYLGLGDMQQILLLQLPILRLPKLATIFGRVDTVAARGQRPRQR